jgi:hypothetical protein
LNTRRHDMKKSKILLVEPPFPIASKSKNYHESVPIGLLKLASYYRINGNTVKFVRGNILRDEVGFYPDTIMVTSLYTYWSEYVRSSVQHYKNLFTNAKVIVGGIYASLMPEHCKDYTGCDEVYVGVHRDAEKNRPAYDLVFGSNPLDFQIIHASRGCFRRCPFCGTWKIEPELEFKESIKGEIQSNRLIFYDNNMLKNPNIKTMLEEIASTKHDGKVVVCESQCGLDGRLLTLKVAHLLKKAHFRYPRIAWDWGYSMHEKVQKQMQILVDAGYNSRDTYVFMLYNWRIPFEEMEQKRLKCWDWKVQIADCRYRPLTQTYDYYDATKKQTNEDYYIHPSWTDAEVKQFRKNVRRQNICVRHGFRFYSNNLEQQKLSPKLTLYLKSATKREVRRMLKDAWFPDRMTPPKQRQLSLSDISS